MELFEQFLQKNRKTIYIVTVAIIAGIIIYNLTIFISRIGKIPITVMYAPFDASITINGKSYKNNQTYYLSPGKYQVEASREHFQTMTLEYEINEDSIDNFIGGLVPDDEEGIEIANNHNDEYLKVEGIGSINAEIEANEVINKNPIIQYLPINQKTYSVSYDYDEQGEFFIELILRNDISQIPQVVATLYSTEDPSPASYKVIVRDYQDPFGDFKQNSNQNISDYLRVGYGDKFNSYKIVENRIIKQDNYYGVLIIPEEDGISYPIYRVILEKKDSGWEMISEPYPVVSQYNASEVPVDFLDKLNRTFVLTDI